MGLAGQSCAMDWAPAAVVIPRAIGMMSQMRDMVASSLSIGRLQPVTSGSEIHTETDWYNM
jgi:hypothetical protein